MIEIVQADITTLQVDAIVNAANAALAGGGGVDGAIHEAAGPELKDALRKIVPGANGVRCPTGQAVLTPGFNLPARFVIHAVGPVWRGGAEDEAKLLESAYEVSFTRAREEPSIRSIAFAAISTGNYAYPNAEAARIALGVMLRHEREFDRIVACLFDAASAELYARTLASLRG